jgi:hypothetical protein
VPFVAIRLRNGCTEGPVDLDESGVVETRAVERRTESRVEGVVISLLPLGSVRQVLGVARVSRHRMNRNHQQHPSLYLLSSHLIPLDAH